MEFEMREGYLHSKQVTTLAEVQKALKGNERVWLSYINSNALK